MSRTTAGAIKARIETLGLGIPVFRDGTDPAHQLKAPYVTIQEGIGFDTDHHGDVGDPTADVGLSELVQVDIYLPARVLAGAGLTSVAESSTIPDRVHRGLHGAQLASVGTARVYGCLVESRLRWPIADNLSRHTLTIRVKRGLQ